MKNTTTINTVIPTELKEKAQIKAQEMNISLNALVRLSLSEYLSKN